MSIVWGAPGTRTASRNGTLGETGNFHIKGIFWVQYRLSSINSTGGIILITTKTVDYHKT